MLLELNGLVPINRHPKSKICNPNRSVAKLTEGKS